MPSHLLLLPASFQVGLFGYLAFAGSGVQGDILLNLEGSVLSDVVKVLYVLTAAVSFPLCIFPCRRSVETLLCEAVSRVRLKWLPRLVVLFHSGMPPIPLWNAFGRGPLTETVEGRCVFIMYCFIQDGIIALTTESAHSPALRNRVSTVVLVLLTLIASLLVPDSRFCLPPCFCLLIGSELSDLSTCLQLRPS